MHDQDEYGNLYVCWKFTSEMLRLCGGGYTVGKVVYYHICNRTTVENLIPIRSPASHLSSCIPSNG